MAHTVSTGPTRTDPDRRSSAPAPDPHRWLILAVIGVAQLMVVLDTTIVNIALPSAQVDLGFATSTRPWVITAYALAFGSLLLLGGRLSDLLGRRTTLLVGLVGFAASSAVGGASVDVGMLISARAVQGLFAALLAPAALSTLNVTFTDPGERNRAFGAFAAIAGGGSVVGLLVGGALTQWLSWRWCLYVNVAFAIPAAAGVLAWIRPRESGRRPRIDLPGAATASAGLFALVYGLSNAQTHGWSSDLTIGMLAASAVLLVAFVVVERAVRSPLLPLRVPTDRTRGGSYLAIAIAFVGMFAAFLFLTYFLQETLGYSPLKTGIAFLPVSFGVAAASGSSNVKLVPRFGPRPLVPVGMLLAAGGMFWLSQLTVTSSYLGGVLGPMLLLGFGVGFAFSPAMNAATSGVRREDAGVGSAMVNTSQQIGGAIGTAALSTVFTSALSHYLAHRHPSRAVVAAATVHGYAVAFEVAAAVFAGGMIITALLLRSGRLEGGSAGEDAPAAG